MIPGSPYMTYWNPSGSVLVKCDDGSVVQLAQLTLDTFDLDDDGVAALFGLELARLVVDSWRSLSKLSRGADQRV